MTDDLKQNFRGSVALNSKNTKKTIFITFCLKIMLDRQVPVPRIQGDPNTLRTSEDACQYIVIILMRMELFSIRSFLVICQVLFNDNR